MPRHTHDHFDNIPAEAVIKQMEDKGFIDLDLVEGIPLQIQQRGVAGAEIVQRLNLLEKEAGLRLEHTLGDFQSQFAGADIELVKDSPKPGREITHLELHQRYIHGHTHRLDPCSTP